MNWRSLRDTALTEINTALGRPVAIERFVETNRLTVTFPSSNHGILSRDTMRWQNWRGVADCDPGAVRWFPAKRVGLPSSLQVIRGLRDLTAHIEIKGWTCDIQEVGGLAAANNDLTPYRTLDEFAEAKCQPTVKDGSGQTLRQNLLHHEIRILNRPDGGGDSFARYLWDGRRTFLLNSGGAHHFSAARYIAARLRVEVPLTGRLDIYWIREDAVKGLVREYDIYALPEEPSHNFRDVMKSFEVSCGVCRVPYPLNEKVALVFLPREEPRTMRASEILRGSGVFDVGAYFERASCTPPIAEW